MIFNTVEKFHEKGFFIQTVRNSGLCKIFPIATVLNKINVKKKSISTFVCSTFYTTTLDKLLIKVISGVINLVFKSKNRQHISKTSIY